MAGRAPLETACRGLILLEAFVEVCRGTGREFRLPGGLPVATFVDLGNSYATTCLHLSGSLPANSPTAGLQASYGLDNLTASGSDNIQLPKLRRHSFALGHCQA